MSQDVLTTAGAVRIVITGEGATYTAAVAQAKKETESLTAVTRTIGPTTVTSVQAASGAIRLFEGDITRNVRAVEKFITMIPGVGAALKAAFPVVGALAFIGVVSRGIEEIAKFKQGMDEAASKSRDGFLSMVGSARLSNDELHKELDVSRNSVAKLLGEHPNLLAIELDDARIASGKLQESLDQSYQKTKQLLEESKAGLVAQLFGKADTREVSDNIENFYKQMRDAQAEVSNALHSSNPADAKVYQDRLAELQKNAVAFANAQIAMRTGMVAIAGGQGGSYAAIHGDQSQNLDTLKQFRALIELDQDNAATRPLLSDSQRRQSGIEAGRAASGVQMQKWRQELEAEKANHSMSLDEEAAFWQKRADAAKRGSTLYNAALMEANKDRAAAQKQAMNAFIEASISAAKEGERGETESQRVSRELGETWAEAQKRDQEETKRMNEAAVKAFEQAQETRKAAEKIAEERIRLDEASGRISRLTAAQELEAVHQRSFADFVSAATALNGQGLSLPTSAQGQMGQFDFQREQDQAAVHAATALGGLTDSVRATAQEFTDLPAILGRTFTEVVTTVNDAILKAATTRDAHGEWKAAGHTIFTGIAKSALQYAEGSLMKLLIGDHSKPDGSTSKPFHVILSSGTAGGSGGGSDDGSGSSSGSNGGLVGKLLDKLGIHLPGGGPGSGPMGTQSNPMFVKSVDGGAGLNGSNSTGSNSTIPGFDGSIPGLSGGGDGSSGGSGFGSFMGNLLGFGGGMAEGGVMQPGGFYLTGERGPELISVGSPSRVHTARETAGILGGGSAGDTHHHWNIDARGANDPAAVHAAVRMGIAKAMPQIAAATINAHRDFNSRRPRSQQV